jgi:hypothetical protein
MTDSSQRVIIERIEPRTWNLRLRDNKTDQVHDIELRGHGPWSVELNGKAEVSSTGDAGAKAQVAPPPDDAITLRLVRSDGGVRVSAVGRGAKAWAGKQATLLGSRWFLDDKGAPVVLLADRPTLISEIKAALPQVSLDLSKYEGAGQPDDPKEPETVAKRGPGKVEPTAPATPPPVARGFKQGGRGFAGKVLRAADTDIRLELSNIGRSDDKVSITATIREGGSGDALRAWTEQRATSLGPWQTAGDSFVALVRDRKTLPEELAEMFPGVRLDVGMYQRPGAKSQAPDLPIVSEDPGAVKILDDTIRRLSESFIVDPVDQGFEFRTVLLRSDRATGVHEGVPVGTALLRIKLVPAAGPTIVAKDWEPLRKTLKTLKRPASQFEVLREYITETVKKAAAAARTGPGAPQPAAPNDASTPTATGKPRGRKKAEPAAGPGPGDLMWTPIVDRGTEGLAARWGEGHFKLLHVGAERYGLFYERDGGGFETLACGSLEAGKAAAGERVAGAREPAPLDARLAQVACAAERKTGRPSNEEITLHISRSENARAVVVIQASGDRVFEWALLNKSVLGGEWFRSEDGLPERRIHDSLTILAELRKEFPGVNIDTKAYKKLTRASAEPVAEPDETAPARTDEPVKEPTLAESRPAEPPPAEARPDDTRHAEEDKPPPAEPPTPAVPDQASQDAALMRSIQEQLAGMLDEED